MYNGLFVGMELNSLEVIVKQVPTKEMLKINGYTYHDGSGRADVVGLFSFFGKICCGT